MCDLSGSGEKIQNGVKAIPLQQAVGMALAHDITEIRRDEFKGRAFKKGHIVTEEDICHLRRLGKEHLFVLTIGYDEMHEDTAAFSLAAALMGEGVAMDGEPKEGKINIVASKDGLLKVDRDALLRLNMLGDVMCATLHANTVVRKGQVVAGTRAIPLVVKKAIVDQAVRIADCGTRIAESRTENAECGALDNSEIRNLPVRQAGPKSEISRGGGIISIKEMRRPRAGVVITGNEVYHGRIRDAFAPIISKKIEEYDGEVVGVYYAPDDEEYIEARLRELIEAGADLLITTGGMSVDPDDVTRFAIRKLGAIDITYGSAVLPGAMFLVAYLPNSEFGIRNSELNTPHSALRIPHSEIRNSELNTPYSALRIPHSEIPILGVPACGMYHKTTIFDLVFPRVLSGERIGRKELAELGHGGLCLNCRECRYPVCPFGK